MKTLQKGFTLIELMIVVAIVGILAAIALPAYQDYMVRAKTTEPLAKIDELKTSIAEFVASNNAVPLDGEAAGLGAAGINLVADSGANAVAKYYNAVAYQNVAANNVRVGARLNGTIHASLNGAWVVMDGTIDSPNSTSVLWDCFADMGGATGGAGAIKYLPSNCRKPISSAPGGGSFSPS